MEPLDIFYVIKVINTNNGVRGYLFDSPKGLQIITGGVTAGITQFTSFQDAQKFLREKKIEKKGIKAYILNNTELIKEAGDMPGITKVDEPMFYLENNKGQKLFYDSQKQIYYWDSNRTVGFPCWKTEDDLKKFINAAGIPINEVMIKTILPKAA